ncbi:DUF6059 family protein [Streptomyces sp. CMB-StM0423]|uniref:DUF6059 family protein n=1 Tax=Streptomyces sp. CMB-StM0423 TaxID=2059884 RepID=UPI000C70DA88|nr:DUF6059 family protein [Streptomyces sp. CMB-StM0423]AUH44543.1 hypothetical protein CXR04_34035 [Streptomyces sp. CMB-StM0423]
MVAALAWLLRALQEALTSLGRVWFFIPPPPPAQPPAPPPPPPGPVPGHPERLRPDLPLTEQEEALRRQLDDIALPDAIGEEKSPGA